MIKMSRETGKSRESKQSRDYKMSPAGGGSRDDVMNVSRGGDLLFSEDKLSPGRSQQTLEQKHEKSREHHTTSRQSRVSSRQQHVTSRELLERSRGKTNRTRSGRDSSRDIDDRLRHTNKTGVKEKTSVKDDTEIVMAERRTTLRNACR